jgi:signal transduction histidine kinase
VRSFTAKIVLRFAVLVTATMGAVLAIGGWLLAREAVRGLDLLNRAEFVEIRDRLGPHPEALSALDVDRRVRPHTRVDAALYYFQIHDQTGKLLFRSANLGPDVLPDLSGGPLQRTEHLADLGEIRLCEFYYGPLHIQIASSLAPANRVLRDDARVSLLLLGGAAVASLALGWGFARLTLRPIRAIHDTAARIRGDNLGERIPVPNGNDELTALARLLNRMFDGLEASFSQARRFTADASHELKTPLALIRLNAEKLRSRLASDPEGSAGLAELLEEIDRLRRITDSLLFLARVESGTFALTTSEIAADAFVQEFAEDAGALAEDADARFEVGCSDSGKVRCEPMLIRQLLLNLTANSLRVSPAGGRVVLASTVAGGRWRLTVTDEGPGLPPGQLERVFERFVRYPPTGGRPGAPTGHGLGLAICRSIATLHGGTISAENRTDRPGLRVCVELACGAG